MKKFLLLLAVVAFVKASSQTPSFPSAGEIYLGIKKLNVLGSVLYIAAHPDDENTRLLTYLSKEKLYRTGYLSLTRGDGGQNLLGEEQGIELGLIRTQELLAARRIDGAEQFFTRAYDFGYSKTPKETFAKWDEEKVLSDVVWVIRKFQPDVIITRFPTTGEGGHGHHTASAMLAVQAFTAAADAKRFPEQLSYVKPWQAKRLLWNTFNFGGNNTTAADQFRVDVGGFNPVLGKSYGEIAAESRSQHKSQGFGSARNRGEAFEQFKTLGGDAPVADLLDGVNTTWARVKETAVLVRTLDSVLSTYSFSAPHKSVAGLFELHDHISSLPLGYWRDQKLAEIKKLIEQASGLWVEASTPDAYVTQGDSVRLNITVNDRAGLGVTLLAMQVEEFDSTFNQSLLPNRNVAFTKTVKSFDGTPITQPYWLVKPMKEGYFDVDNQQLIGAAESEPAFAARFSLQLNGRPFIITKPVYQKSVDQVKGELYQPVTALPNVSVNTTPGLVLLNRNKLTKQKMEVQLAANKTVRFNRAQVSLNIKENRLSVYDSTGVLPKGTVRPYGFELLSTVVGDKTVNAIPAVKFDVSLQQYLALASVKYDHIPAINYFYTDWLRLVPIDLKTAGKKVGYITGAGDRVPEALEQMGYEVVTLGEKELDVTDLNDFDAVIAGVRAFNSNEWMGKYYNKLMAYVEGGGNYIVQYSQSNNIKTRIGPYNFNISRARITDENAAVNFLKPEHPVFNLPNKLSAADFKDWVQERSIYHAEGWAPNYEPLIRMADPDEAPHDGSLIVAKHGKGYFTYTGLVFFRQLPNGVPGAYRLLANLIALNKKN